MPPAERLVREQLCIPRALGQFVLTLAA